MPDHSSAAASDHGHPHDRGSDRAVGADALPARRATDRAADRAASREPPRAPRPDRALHLLLLAAEREARVGVTVCTAGGVTVTGRLVSTRTFARHLADHFTTPGGSTEMDATFADALRDLVDDAITVAQGDRRSAPDAAAYEHATAFLHLAEARVVAGAGVLPAGRHGVLWRCRVCDVHGWALGDLVPG